MIQANTGWQDEVGRPVPDFYFTASSNRLGITAWTNTPQLGLWFSLLAIYEREPHFTPSTPHQ